VAECTFIPTTNQKRIKKRPLISGEIANSSRTSHSGLQQILAGFDKAANIAEREAMGSDDITVVETYDNREASMIELQMD
jgi:hypothetical protein